MTPAGIEPATFRFDIIMSTKSVFFLNLNCGWLQPVSPSSPLPVLLRWTPARNGCKTWSLIQKEERRLRLFENRVLRKIFGIERNEAPGMWRKLRNEFRGTLFIWPLRLVSIRFKSVRCVGYEIFEAVIFCSRSTIIQSLHCKCTYDCSLIDSWQTVGLPLS